MGALRWLQACLTLVVLLFTRGAHAQQAEPLSARLRLEQGQVRTQFSVTNAFTEAFRKRLAGGLTSRAVLAIELLDPNGQTMAVRRRRCELRLDVWDDQIYIRVQDEQRLRRRIFALIDNALQACGLVDIAVVPIERLTAADGYQVRVTVALNPVSAELLERSRQFTSNPRGASGRPQAFFGAVARLFRSESDAGGTVFVFQTGRMSRPSEGASSP